MTGHIPFDEINAAALAAYPGLLSELFPAGKLVGHEFQVGDLHGAPGESLSVNVRTGAWADFAGDAKGGDPIGLYAARHGRNRVEAARELGQRFGLIGDGTGPAKGGKPSKRIVVAYDYVSAAGELLFQVVRY